MFGEWMDDLESLEAISQDDLARCLFLRMAELDRTGRLEPFLDELQHDRELDERTKRLVADLAQDAGFLHAVDDYVRRTAVLH